ncbi:hypothetical protein [Lacticaseibacillus paracasei]|uniref:hypothetical protein n=1 Tax=Lacticaseibacillus paracasei TaxID=1597 RepID=UPI0021D0FFA5|nr:hypothetical protein [Lacticaseibacillus paracasei]MCU6432062.1 hypothetical protein [Lacticaseibacillus paracasei]
MRYLINEYVEDFGNAGSKARRDISSILEKNNTTVINLPYDSKKSHLRREFETWRTLGKYLSLSTVKGQLVVQFPLRLNKLDQFGVLNMVKKFQSKVVIIHDLESLRRGDNSLAQSEVKFLNKFDLVISHSSNMTKYLRKHGLNTEVRDLYLFDYLADQKENSIKQVFSSSKELDVS